MFDHCHCKLQSQPKNLLLYHFGYLKKTFDICLGEGGVFDRLIGSGVGTLTGSGVGILTGSGVGTRTGSYHNEFLFFNFAVFVNNNCIS